MGFTLTGSASTLLCGVLALSQDARGWGSVALGWVRVHRRFGEAGCQREPGGPRGLQVVLPVLSPLAHWFSRRQLSKVRVPLVFGFSAHLHSIGATVRSEPGTTSRVRTRSRRPQQAVPSPTLPSRSLLEGDGCWGSSANPGTKST